MGFNNSINGFAPKGNDYIAATFAQVTGFEINNRRNIVVISKETTINIRLSTSKISEIRFEPLQTLFGLMALKAEQKGQQWAEQKVVKLINQKRLAYIEQETENAPVTFKHHEDLKNIEKEVTLIGGDTVIKDAKAEAMTEEEWEELQAQAMAVAIVYQQAFNLSASEKSSHTPAVKSQSTRNSETKVHSSEYQRDTVAILQSTEKEVEKEHRTKRNLLEKQMRSHEAQYVRDRQAKIKANHERWEKKSEKLFDRNSARIMMCR